MKGTNRKEQNRTEQKGTEQNRTEQNRKGSAGVVAGDSVYSWAGATAAPLCAEQPGTTSRLSTRHHR